MIVRNETGRNLQGFFQLFFEAFLASAIIAVLHTCSGNPRSFRIFGVWNMAHAKAAGSSFGATCLPGVTQCHGDFFFFVCFEKEVTLTLN